jgi:porphobilinogen synthase
MIQETALTPRSLIQPLFVRTGTQGRRPVSSMPGVFQLSVDQAVLEARAVQRLGLKAVILFGLPDKKDPTGSDASDPDGVVQRAVRAIKRACPDLLVITDLCLCEYTDHGHCGILKNKAIDNDATLERLGRIAVVQAQSGADWVAPSGMMDGAVRAVRRALDKAGLTHTAILAYAAKYASAFYGPFRDAAQSAPAFGDRRTHQMDPANAREALREVALDVREGADLVMVKPALAYLDVIRQIKDRVSAPVVAYNVSGEYALVKAGAAKGWIDEPRLVDEILLSIKRAGADLIISYHALEWARRFRNR